MSRASEWVKAIERVDRLQVADFECRQLPMVAQDAPHPIHAALGRKGEEPMLCLTDGRLGGIYLSGHNALALAGWIRQAFGEKDCRDEWARALANTSPTVGRADAEGGA